MRFYTRNAEIERRRQEEGRAYGGGPMSLLGSSYRTTDKVFALNCCVQRRYVIGRVGVAPH